MLSVGSVYDFFGLHPEGLSLVRKQRSLQQFMQVNTLSSFQVWLDQEEAQEAIAI